MSKNSEIAPQDMVYDREITKDAADRVLKIAAKLSPEDRKAFIADRFREIMAMLQLDIHDASLKDTPMRVAKMYHDELFKSVNGEDFPNMTSFPNDNGYDQMVLVREIETRSVCEHHFMPIVGKTHIAYLPDDTVIGLSKLNRVVQFVGAKPQVQERMTKQIADILQVALNTENVAVMIEADHFCTSMRGAKDCSSNTVTTFLGGVFKSGLARKEFFDSIRK